MTYQLSKEVYRPCKRTESRCFTMKVPYVNKLGAPEGVISLEN